MNPKQEVTLQATPINRLRPTQMTVGMYEVRRKRKAWAERDKEKLEDYLARHMVPVVIGPDHELFLIDHHHLARALLEEGMKSVFVHFVDDFSMVKGDAFWALMEYHRWVHPYDGKGRRREYGELPKAIADMKDDPYRSLSGELRNVGGFAKDALPFAEFAWADFFRPRIKARAIERDFSDALGKAMIQAKSNDASYLPGWCGGKGGLAALAMAMKLADADA